MFVNFYYWSLTIHLKSKQSNQQKKNNPKNDYLCFSVYFYWPPQDGSRTPLCCQPLSLSPLLLNSLPYIMSPAYTLLQQRTFLASVLLMNHETFQKCSTPVPFLGFLPLFTLSPPSWCCCFRPWPDAETSLAEGSHSLLHSWLKFAN